MEGLASRTGEPRLIMEMVHTSAAELGDEVGSRVVGLLRSKGAMLHGIVIHSDIDRVLSERSRQRIFGYPFLSSFACRKHATWERGPRTVENPDGNDRTHAHSMHYYSMQIR